MEQKLRRSYTRFIQQLGKTLRLPQEPTIATATILCHRFFLRQSHAKNDSLLIASACLFLASKSEDTPRRLAHIASAAYNLRFGTRTAPDDANALENKGLQKESERLILLAEHLILCTLGFELEVELPYKRLNALLRVLKENPAMQKELIKLGERRLKSQREGTAQTAKVDQVFDGHVPMNVESYAHEHTNMDRHMGDVVDAQNNVCGKLSQPIPTDNSGFNHAGVHHGSGNGTYKQSRNVNGKLSQPVLTDNSGFNHAGVHHGNGNGTYKQSRIGPDYVSYAQADRHASDYVHTQYFREGETSFHQVAWNFVNDTLLTLMCIQFKPHHLAAGAVWLAAKFLGVKLPSDGERAWWKEMNVMPLELEEVGHQFIEVYTAEEEANRRKGANPQSVSKPHSLSR